MSYLEELKRERNALMLWKLRAGTRYLMVLYRVLA